MLLLRNRSNGLFMQFSSQKTSENTGLAEMKTLGQCHEGTPHEVNKEKNFDQLENHLPFFLTSMDILFLKIQIQTKTIRSRPHREVVKTPYSLFFYIERRANVAKETIKAIEANAVVAEDV